MLDTVLLTIAGFQIEIRTEPGYRVELENGWQPFRSKAPNKKPDALIHSKPGIPEALKEKKGLLFEADNTDQTFYTICRHGEGLKFIIYSQMEKGTVQQVAFTNKTFSRWNIYSLPTIQKALVPLLYPMGPLLMYYLTVNRDAMMIHASGVYDGEKGRVFTGFSGKGKSTISGIWARNNSTLINDDRLIIKKEADKFYMHNTPMYYEDAPRKAPVDSVFIISHSSENVIKKIDDAEAVTHILAHCVQNNYNRDFIAYHIGFLAGFCEHTDVYLLGFVPDNTVVDFILENESSL